ncbi:MAG: helix-turn-helix transcriptional regulator [Porticoccaceae bacterium]
MREETPLYLSDNQLAARFGISRNSIWRLVKTGQLCAPVKLFKSTTRWKISDIETFEAARAAESRKRLEA